MNRLAELAGMPDAPHLSIAPSGSLGSLLCVKIAMAQKLSNTAAQRFWSNPDLPRVFPSFLVELYSLVSCSVPLMTAAYERALELAANDPLAARTAEYLKQHIEEELNHDEWLLNDLVASGMDRAELLHHTPSKEIAQLVGMQYCWIHHAHPAALFGYLGVIEGNPPVNEHLEEIRVQTGYPAETFRCMHLHAADDVEHLRELTTTIKNLPLSVKNEALIAKSAFATLDAVVILLESLMTNVKLRQD